MEDFKEFMQSQMEQILIHKWIESEKEGKDLGENAVYDWVKKYADAFRKWWENKKEL
jgi:hypothetical protein